MVGPLAQLLPVRVAARGRRGRPCGGPRPRRLARRAAGLHAGRAPAPGGVHPLGVAARAGPRVGPAGSIRAAADVDGSARGDGGAGGRPPHGVGHGAGDHARRRPWTPTRCGRRWRRPGRPPSTPRSWPACPPSCRPPRALLGPAPRLVGVAETSLGRLGLVCLPQASTDPVDAAQVAAAVAGAGAGRTGDRPRRTLPAKTAYGHDVAAHLRPIPSP
ncbi:MAG: hypothetical protein R3F43_30720 [bacterium]